MFAEKVTIVSSHFISLLVHDLHNASLVNVSVSGVTDSLSIGIFQCGKMIKYWVEACVPDFLCCLEFHIDVDIGVNHLSLEIPRCCRKLTVGSAKEVILLGVTKHLRVHFLTSLSKYLLSFLVDFNL